MALNRVEYFDNILRTDWYQQDLVNGLTKYLVFIDSRLSPGEKQTNKQNSSMIKVYHFLEISSRKHTYIILTPLNPTFIQ